MPTLTPGLCRGLGIALLLLVADGAAQDAAAPDQAWLRDLRDQALQLEAQAAERSPPAWLTPDPARSAAMAVAGAGTTAAAALPALATDPQWRAQLCETLGRCPSDAEVAAIARHTQGAPDGPVISILVSRSLGEAALRTIFAQAAAQHEPPARVVFRGILPGESLLAFMRLVHGWLAGMDPPPLVELDPTPFQQTGASSVPLMVLHGAQGEVARVAGLTDPAWLLEQVADGRTGDLGTRGPVMGIAEPDMLAEIHRRLAALDLDALRQGAVERFWQRTAMTHLPPVREARVRELDPTVELQQDLRDADGKLMFAAGTRFNPFDHAAFRLRVIVFDATDPAQIAIARAAGDQQDGRRPVFVTTRLDREAGWDALAQLEDRLDAPVYLLTPDLRERFALTAVPSIIDAHDGRLRVTEVPVHAR